MYELTLGYICILIGTGFLAGIINTMAGGGSNLTIPALMVMGLPADTANATNRIAVLLQCLTAARGFKKHGKLDIAEAQPVILLTLAGGLVGALTASWLPPDLLKPILLGSMLTMAAIILFKPSVIAPPEGTPALRIKDNPGAIPLLLLAGFYGGFVQAGVGFILIVAIAGGLRYDLVRTNALKIVCTAAFTAVALAIFIVNDQILWVPGLILASGTMIGAHIAVRITINISQKALKWFLFLMTLAASAAAMLS